MTPLNMSKLIAVIHKIAELEKQLTIQREKLLLILQSEDEKAKGR